MLRPFGEEIWIADGPAVSIAGFAYPTRMVAMRLPDGGVFIWSPIALPPELKASVDGLGPVRHIVAPNALHHLFVGEWQSAYPDAASHAAPGLRAKRPDLRWDSDLGDAPGPEWLEDIDQVVVRGNWITAEVVFFHRRSRTAIFTDLIQNFEPGWFRGWRGLAASLDRLTAPKPTVPMKFRGAFYNRGTARKALERIMAWPIEGVLAAHCPPIPHDGRDAIAHAFQWLAKR